MTAVRLQPEPVAKPWGRRDLWPWAADIGSDDAPIGELIYRHPDVADPALLLKTIFTSERLSVQVHPSDAEAQARGLPHGKDEAWIVLAAEPGATIGYGLTAVVGEKELRAAAQDGAIVDMLDWRPVVAGSVFEVPAGTIHAIGDGVTVLEVQQNLDITYRLHDYGRGRALHLDDGLAVARREPAPAAAAPRQVGDRAILVQCSRFVIERVRLDGRAALAPAHERPVWLAALSGEATIGGAPLSAGEVWYCDGDAALAGSAELVLAYPGGELAAALWTAGARAGAA